MTVCKHVSFPLILPQGGHPGDLVPLDGRCSSISRRLPNENDSSWAGRAGFDRSALPATLVPALSAIGTMARAFWLALAACLTANLARVLSSVPTQNMEFTYLLPAGSRECFFQSVEKDSRLEFEYQVRYLVSLVSFCELLFQASKEHRASALLLLLKLWTTAIGRRVALVLPSQVVRHWDFKLCYFKKNFLKDFKK